MPLSSGPSRCMVAEAYRVTVTYGFAPRLVWEAVVSLLPGSTVAQALQESGIFQRFPGLDLNGAGLGIWGRKVSGKQQVRDGDRVEVYRPLRVDPKVARRERFRKQGARTAGLFARRRPGAKPGY